MFLYNFAYVASSPVEGTFFSRFFALPPQLIAAMAFLLIGGMLLLVQMSQGEFSEAQRRFAGLLFLTIAIEFVLSRLSRQSFLHYSTGLVLLAALLAGMILKGFARGIERISSPKSRHALLPQNQDLADLEMRELDLYLGRNYVVSIYRSAEMPPVERVWNRLEKDDRLFKNGADFLCHALLDALVDDYMECSEGPVNWLREAEIAPARPAKAAPKTSASSL